jgi:DNA-binding response OmpR family regulator
LNASTLILAVEDEDDIAEFLRAYFRASGYELVRSDPSSPDEIFDAIVEHAPALVLLDYGLRGFSGHDAYRLLREQERFDALPVIVVTADATARTKTQEAASGLDGFVTKPFNVNTLADLVAERIAAAEGFAAGSTKETAEVMTQRVITARLDDEVAAAPPDHTVSFVLVRLPGRAPAMDELMASARRGLPAGAVLGRIDANELALIVPGVSADALAPMMDAVLAEVRDLEPLAGLASFPLHASSADELYMAADAALADAAQRGGPLRVAI